MLGVGLRFIVLTSSCFGFRVSGSAFFPFRVFGWFSFPFSSRQLAFRSPPHPSGGKTVRPVHSSPPSFRPFFPRAHLGLAVLLSDGVLYLLSVVEVPDPLRGDAGAVDEDVLRAVVGGDEAEAGLHVEPLHRAGEGGPVIVVGKERHVCCFGIG